MSCKCNKKDCCKNEVVVPQLEDELPDAIDFDIPDFGVALIVDEPVCGEEGVEEAPNLCC